MPITPIDTGRLIVRSLTESDIDALYDLESDPEVKRYLGGPTRHSRGAYHRDLLNHPRGEYDLLAIVHKATGKFGGRCSLKSKRPGDREMEIVITRPYWRQGLGLEIGLQLIGLAFEDPTIDSVVGVVHPENLASQGLMKKLGMVPTSEYIDPDYPANLVFKIGRES